MKLIEHVYAIKNVLSRGPISDDFRLSDRLIAHYLQVARARLIEQKIDKYYYISEQSYQDLCINLELSSFHDCCNMPEFEDCKIMKSITEIPKFLNSRWGNHLKVMDMVGNVLPEISLTQSKYSKYALVPQTIGWFLHNNHIYLVNTKVLSNVLLNALFASPEDINNLNCPGDGTNCPDFMSEEFPIDSDLIDPMYRVALELMSAAYNFSIDTENNTKDVDFKEAIQ